MTNLSHTASFHSNERIAPSNRGIKHLEGPQVAALNHPRITYDEPFLLNESILAIK
jgi:hypothetical protein